MRRQTVLATLVLALASTAPLLAQQPPVILHGQVSTQSAERGLTAQIDALKRSATPLWAGYIIPVADQVHRYGSGDTTFLEEGGGRHAESGDESKPVSTNQAILLMRIANGNVEKLRVETSDRRIDTGGLRFVWLTGVTPADSIRTLRTLIVTGGAQQLREEAVFLIALHRAPEATPALVEIAGPGSELLIRERAAFWLANQRGHDGFLAIQHLAQKDPDATLREKVTFDLTLSKDPGALPELIRMAHDDASPLVRKQAQFWMATTGGKKIAGDLRDAAEHDPNSAVRQAAVFSLTRLPGDEAATQLIQIAQTSKDPAVRKQAVFWLGQSKDPRALDYLTRILTQ